MSHYRLVGDCTTQPVCLTSRHKICIAPPLLPPPHPLVSHPTFPPPHIPPPPLLRRLLLSSPLLRLLLQDKGSFISALPVPCFKTQTDANHWSRDILFPPRRQMSARKRRNLHL